ncbi:MAG: YdcF family protein [Alphaproteobacteria bacterium]|nr:YdcF family protein [Alphaproteobacteria bacterium]
MRLFVLALFAVACKRVPPDPGFGADAPLDVVLVPGCPSRDDGTLSGCQWQRAIWAADLWEDGVTGAFITSGNAVYNRYIEAEAVKAGMVALGVPEDRIHLETQALHTDQNAGYALRMMDALGFETLGVASHGGHARGARAMLRGWGHGAVALQMDMERVGARMREGLPTVRTEPVPEDEWMPLKAREKLIARRTGRLLRRPNSVVVYSWKAMVGGFTKQHPPRPPTSEPTLDGARHRVDTRPWSTTVDARRRRER